MPKILKGVIGWILYIAILIGLIVGIPKGLAYVLKTDYPMASITSGSMWPVLKKGDLAFIKGIDSKNDIKVGDIVVYQNPKGFTIHRIIEMDETTITTKGDANNVKDAPVRYEEIIGKTLTINNNPLKIPLLGMISVWMHKDKI